MEKLFPSLSKAREDSSSLAQLDNIIVGNFFNSIEYEISGIIQKIQDIDNIDIAEIRHIITNQHSMILNYDLFLMDADTRHQAQKLFTNKRFLQCFLEVIGTIELSSHEKICINKIAYDYYTFMEKDEEVSDLLFQITTWVNNLDVLVLSGIIGMNGAKILAMIRHSSFKEDKCVHRVNTFIIRCGINLSVQNIIDIYCRLFDHFTPLFVNSMLETKPTGFTQDQSNRFDAISLALLIILDSMDSINIKKVLTEYAFYLNMILSKSSVRFSLHTAANYPRILHIVKEIEVVENMNII